jgi:hypothetical protein
MTAAPYQITIRRLLLATTWFAAAAAIVTTQSSSSIYIATLTCSAVWILVCGGVGTIFGRTMAALVSGCALLAFFGGIIGIFASLWSPELPP